MARLHSRRPQRRAGEGSAAPSPQGLTQSSQQQAWKASSRSVPALDGEELRLSADAHGWGSSSANRNGAASPLPVHSTRRWQRAA